MRLLSCNQLAGGQNKHGERDGESELPVLVIKKAFNHLFCALYSALNPMSPSLVGFLLLCMEARPFLPISKICIRFPLENPRFSIWL